MDDIRNIVSAIRDIADTEVHAEEKLFLWWKKLFLVEKNMSNRDKKGLIFLVNDYLMKKRVYHFQNNFLSPACFGNIDFFEELGAKGYFEATPENLSCYLGGFAKANKSAQVHNVSELYTINQANIDVDRYIDLLYERLDNFSIERYCSYL